MNFFLLDELTTLLHLMLYLSVEGGNHKTCSKAHHPDFTSPPCYSEAAQPGAHSPHLTPALLEVFASVGSVLTLETAA